MGTARSVFHFLLNLSYFSERRGRSTPPTSTLVFSFVLPFSCVLGLGSDSRGVHAMIHAALLFRKWALPTFVVRRSISRPFSFHHHHHHVRYFWDHRSIFTDSKPSSSS